MAVDGGGSQRLLVLRCWCFKDLKPGQHIEFEAEGKAIMAIALTKPCLEAPQVTRDLRDDRTLAHPGHRQVEIGVDPGCAGILQVSQAVFTHSLDRRLSRP